MLCTVPALHSRLLVAQSKTNHMNKSKYKYKTNLTFDKLIPTSMDINDYKKISLITNDISVKEVISDENNTTLYVYTKVCSHNQNKYLISLKDSTTKDNKAQHAFSYGFLLGPTISRNAVSASLGFISLPPVSRLSLGDSYIHYESSLFSFLLLSFFSGFKNWLLYLLRSESDLNMSRELSRRLLLLQYPRDYDHKKGKKKHNYTGWAKLTVRSYALKMFGRK